MSEPPSSPMKGAGPTFPLKQWIELGACLEKTKSPDKALLFDAAPVQMQLTPATWVKVQDVLRSMPLRQYEHKDDTPWQFDPSASVADCNGAALGRMKALCQAAPPPAPSHRPTSMKCTGPRISS